MSKRIFLALFLDEASKKLLLEVFQPKHPKVFAEHLTLAFGGAVKGLPDEFRIGHSVVPFDVCGWAENEKGQTAICSKKGLESLLAPDQPPHITISCAEGVPPKYSKELLTKAENKPLVTTLTLKGVLDYFPRTTI
jgi:hypothetical protein